MNIQISLDNVQKWRETWESGETFVTNNLIQLTREESTNFTKRKKLTYTPAGANEAIQDVMNAFWREAYQITRTGGPTTYQDSLNNVDRKRSTMTMFMQRCLQEAFIVKRVGVFVDMDANIAPTVVGSTERPYLVMIKTEQIKTVEYNDKAQLSRVIFERDGVENSFTLLDDGVVHEIEAIEFTRTVNLDAIPFVLLEFDKSLMEDNWKAQVALLNLSSVSTAFVFDMTFPFYTEQTSGTVQAGTQKTNDEVALGKGVGRTYPKGLDRPDFISPKTDLVDACMKKAEVIKADIRRNINLALRTLASASSADSKEYDDSSMVAGLIAIAEKVQVFEQTIGDHWAMYDTSGGPLDVKYPKAFEHQSAEQRRAAAKDLTGLADATNSILYKRTVQKRVTRQLFSGILPDELIAQIELEIDSNKVPDTSVKTAIECKDAGLVGTETCATGVGYPAGESEIAKQEFAERLAVIKELQSNTQGTGEGVRDPTAKERLTGTPENQRGEGQ